ncbi:MAG: ParB/RepB/Spo0J family partition protein [bacterium]|nr:ParB/RepB/Spo0J family partition protein [bacterium]
MAKMTGLGKGFDALLPDDFDDSVIASNDERITNLLVTDIQPSPDQPRRNFDQQSLEELAQSLEKHGIIQPLVVTEKNGVYFIIAGERRWRAAQIAGLTKVPTVIRSTQDLERLEIALIENVQRVDLSPLEQAHSINRLNSEFNVPFDEIAKRLGKGISTVNNIVRLLQLPKEAKVALKEKKISEGHARTVLALKDFPEKQALLLRSIIDNGWSVRQAEQFVVSTKKGAVTKKEVKKQMQTTTKETKELGQKIKSKVTIKHTAKGGRLELHFKDMDDMNRIINLLSN